MNYWLVKSEPDDCGIQHFVDKGSTAICWDGVRNYQARNFLRKMDTDDLVFLYHSSCKVIGIAGTLKVTRAAYPDPLQFDVALATSMRKAPWTSLGGRLWISFWTGPLEPSLVEPSCNRSLIR